MRALVEGLASELGDWAQEASSGWRDLKSSCDVQFRPVSAGLALVAEEVPAGVHVFLMRDAKPNTEVDFPGKRTAILPA